MTVKCPQCRTVLNPFAIRHHFKCMTCRAELEGNRTAALIFAVLAWFVLDAVLRLVLYRFFRITSTQVLVGTGIVLAIIMYSVCMDLCASVKKPEQSLQD